jgi:uncharacterized protein (DUF2147 family)
MFEAMHPRKILKLFFVFIWSCAAAGAADPPLVGIWRTIDDKTHQTRGLVRLYEQDGAVFGKIEKSFDPKEAQDVCDKCSGERHNQPVVGMVVVRNMKKHSATEYTEGDILDPDSGRVYRCKMTIDDDGRKLTVRGYLGISIAGRSQVWLRQE